MIRLLYVPRGVCEQRGIVICKYYTELQTSYKHINTRLIKLHVALELDFIGSDY